MEHSPLLDLLPLFPFGEYEPLQEDMPWQEIFSMEIEEWCLVFSGSSTYRGGGRGVRLYSPNGANISFAFKLEFLCCNNEAEVWSSDYKAHLYFKDGSSQIPYVEGDTKLISK